MRALFNRPIITAVVGICYFAIGLSAYAQSAGSSSSVTGTVLDPTGAVVSQRLSRNL